MKIHSVYEIENQDLINKYNLNKDLHKDTRSMNTLLDKPWMAYILDVQEGQIIVSGGKSQGLKQGDILKVMKRGRMVKNPQTGFEIELPRVETAKLKVVSFAGDGNNEVSICTLTSGSIKGIKVDQLIVQEL